MIKRNAIACICFLMIVLSASACSVKETDTNEIEHPAGDEGAMSIDMETKDIGGRQITIKSCEISGDHFYTPANTEFPVLNIYFGNTGAEFYRIVKEEDRLIVDGNLLKDGKKPVIGRAIIVLRSSEDCYSFASTGSMNGRFFADIDLSGMKPGEYVISLLSGVSDDRDALTKNINKGYFKTDYKITVN